MNEKKFIKNMIDQMKEAQMKLGFAKETVRFYYPVSTLNAMLGTDAANADEMLAILNSDIFRRTDLGELKFSSHKQRIEVSVPPEGAEYVHSHIPEPAFLAAMIELFRSNHHCSMEDVEQLFAAYSPDYVCEQMPEGSDFDRVFYFKDETIDPYYYCVKEEMGHTIYHRFTKEDMAELY